MRQINWLFWINETILGNKKEFLPHQRGGEDPRRGLNSLGNLQYCRLVLRALQTRRSLLTLVGAFGFSMRHLRQAEADISHLRSKGDFYLLPDD